jgi:YbgC/YbaW family acyl-CoA thioester hydrolase
MARRDIATNSTMPENNDERAPDVLPTPADFRALERLRVRWAEIDAQQIVFNGHYLMYFDTAMTAYWRAMAMPYAGTMARLGGDLYVRKATVEYRASARYDDRLDVGVRCRRIGTSSLAYGAAAFRRGELLVAGELVYVYADPAAQRSRPVPASLRGAIESFEAGEPPVAVETGPWTALGEEASALRRAVFVEEQKVPLDLEWDGADDGAVHAVARNRLGHAVATGRLLAAASGVGRIGRMAVADGIRGSGVGRAVLDALLAASRARGDREAVLHAQCSAATFYERAGFEARGPVFEEAGIAHVEMARAP